MTAKEFWSNKYPRNTGRVDIESIEFAEDYYQHKLSEDGIDLNAIEKKVDKALENNPPEIEEKTEKDIVVKFTENILSHNVPLEFVDIVNDNFWDLVGSNWRENKSLHKAEEKPELVDRAISWFHIGADKAARMNPSKLPHDRSALIGFLKRSAEFLQKHKDQPVHQPVREISEEILGSNNPWPLKDVLNQLVKASEILLGHHSYDGHNYEEIQTCVKTAKAIINKSNGE